MNRILSFILIASFFSITFADFFHLQFHKMENERISQSSTSSKKTNSTPLDDHCEFQKCTNILNKNLILNNIIMDHIVGPIIVDYLHLNTVVINREAQYFSSLSARGPPPVIS